MWYCGHLYSSLLCKWTWWDHRAQLSLYKESVKTTLSPVQYNCASHHLLLAILRSTLYNAQHLYQRWALDLVCCALCCATHLCVAVLWGGRLVFNIFIGLDIWIIWGSGGPALLLSSLVSIFSFSESVLSLAVLALMWGVRRVSCQYVNGVMVPQHVILLSHWYPKPPTSDVRSRECLSSRRSMNIVWGQCTSSPAI